MFSCFHDCSKLKQGGVVMLLLSLFSFSVYSVFLIIFKLRYLVDRLKPELWSISDKSITRFEPDSLAAYEFASHLSPTFHSQAHSNYKNHLFHHDILTLAGLTLERGQGYKNRNSTSELVPEAEIMIPASWRHLVHRQGVDLWA